MTPSGEQVWAALLQDPDFTIQSRAVVDIHYPFVTQLPSVIAEFLDQPVSLESLARAKAKYAAHCLENGFPKALSLALSRSKADKTSIDRLTRKQIELMTKTVENLEAMLERATSLLAESKLDESYYIINMFQLNDTARLLYEQGELTVGRLLLVDPLILTRVV